MTGDPAVGPGSSLPLLAGLASTRTIRRYTDEPIPEADLAQILWHATSRARPPDRPSLAGELRRPLLHVRRHALA
ncbi:MAG: nitroreductase family protein, partial [Ilumatobacteraceae bacterium]